MGYHLHADARLHICDYHTETHMNLNLKTFEEFLFMLHLAYKTTKIIYLTFYINFPFCTLYHDRLQAK